MFEKKEKLEMEQEEYYSKAKEYLKNPQKTEGLLKKAIQKANDNKGTLGEARERLKLLIEMVTAYSKGEYKNVSTSTILTVIGAIVYFVSPLDMIPDFIIGLGIMDDAAVIAYTLKKLGKEVDEFKKWKHSALFASENPFD